MADSASAAPSFNRTVAIVTVSDRGSRGEREDSSGRALAERMETLGYEVVYRIVVADEIPEVTAALQHCADKRKVALILTTGGTGVSPRDVTPDATMAVLDRLIPGMAEAMRAASLQKTPHAMISRAIAGIRGSTLVVNLPGSPKGAIENLEVIVPALPHAIEKIQGDPSECAQR